LIDEEDEPVVCDFGLTKHDAQSEEAPSNKSAVVGTRFYRSPEQQGGRSTYYSTDVYSLGVVMWELLFVTPQFDKTRHKRTFLDFRHTLQSGSAQQTDEGTRQLILECTNPNRKERPTAREVFYRLHNLRSDILRIERAPFNTFPPQEPDPEPEPDSDREVSAGPEEVAVVPQPAAVFPPVLHTALFSASLGAAPAAASAGISSGAAEIFEFTPLANLLESVD
jgi:serine/threonine protein kinase